LSIHPRFKPPWTRKARYGLAFVKIVVKLGLRPSTAYYYWRNFLAVLFTRVSALETVVNLMAMHLHFTRQAKFVSRVMADRIQLLQATVVSEDVDKAALIGEKISAPNPQLFTDVSTGAVTLNL